MLLLLKVLSCQLFQISSLFQFSLIKCTECGPYVPPTQVAGCQAEEGVAPAQPQACEQVVTVQGQEWVVRVRGSRWRGAGP